MQTHFPSSIKNVRKFIKKRKRQLSDVFKVVKVRLTYFMCNMRKIFNNANTNPRVGKDLSVFHVRNPSSSRRNYFRLPQQFLAWLRNNVEARASTLHERGGKVRVIKYGAPQRRAVCALSRPVRSALCISNLTPRTLRSLHFHATDLSGAPRVRFP